MDLYTAVLADKCAAEAIAAAIGGRAMGMLRTGRASFVRSAQAIETQKLVEKSAGL